MPTTDEWSGAARTAYLDCQDGLTPTGYPDGLTPTLAQGLLA